MACIHSMQTHNPTTICTTRQHRYTLYFLDLFCVHIHISKLAALFSPRRLRLSVYFQQSTESYLCLLCLHLGGM